MRYIVPLLLVLSVGCGPKDANPCATKGATYFAHYVEANNGTCGPVPDAIVNISKDGTVAGSADLNCESQEQDGCTGRNTNCTKTTNGVTCTVTTSNTFASNGASASGLMTATCTVSGSTCTSSYQVTMTRQ